MSGKINQCRHKYTTDMIIGELAWGIQVSHSIRWDRVLIMSQSQVSLSETLCLTILGSDKTHLPNLKGGKECHCVYIYVHENWKYQEINMYQGSIPCLVVPGPVLGLILVDMWLYLT